MAIILNLNILITGANGFLGSAVAAELIQNHPDIGLLFLVRGDSAQNSLDRLIEALQKQNVSSEQLTELSKEQMLCADLGSFEQLMDDPRLATITHVVNCAAVPSFANNPSIRKVNVDDTLLFARCLSKFTNIQRFLQVGTAMICGDVPSRVIFEDQYPAPTHHFVTYTETKAEGELLLPEALGDIPLIVARPSIIVGHSQLGCKPSPSIFWVFRMFIQAWCSPIPLKCKIDVVPVDYVAQSMVHLLLKNNLLHSRYHISAGAEHSCNYHEITDCFVKTLGLQHSEPILEASLDYFAKNLKQFPKWFGSGNPRLIYRAMKLYHHFAGLDVTFDNSRLLAEGMAPSPRFTNYLDTCIKTGTTESLLEQMKYDFK